MNDGVLAVLHLAKAFGTVLTIDIGKYERQQQFGNLTFLGERTHSTFF